MSKNISKPLKNDDTIFVTYAHLCGTCEKCQQPSTGEFNSDDDRDDNEMYWATLKCVGCGHTQKWNVEPTIAGFEYFESDM